ncbi:MAG TPA: ATP-grasp domain-containing protein [Chthoniobacterales bacterium]|jgi:diaminopimelate decarboxylase|nr:ATP-grasp domain-containing protein [Chthoniobacterales bacterium]
MKIYISGLYSGTSPQPGIGLSRSLRIAYPHATLVGVEYSNRSSGIHWLGFDELWLQRPWEELDLPAYAEQIGELLEGGALWISGTDLEALWLASVFPDGHANLLSPPAAGLRRITKPGVEAHKGLPLQISPFVSTDESDWDLHAFCRQHDWRVWLKGPYYEAVRTRSWDHFQAVRSALAKVWSTERLFLQAHVSGYEESIMLAAYKGELLGCVSMRKRELTEDGKTWAGDVTELPEEFATPLRKVVLDVNWTGGAELEMVRDPEGKCWLLEWNPRFPAWVHGATIAGCNLPAMLVEAATGIPAEKTKAESEEFTRVVLEVPVRPRYPLPPLPEPYAGGIGHSMKHPSGMPALAERLHKLHPHLMGSNGKNGHGTPESNGLSSIPPSFLHDLARQDFDRLETPSFLFLDSTAASLFDRASALARRSSSPELQVRNGYSIKTNPDARLIKLALDSGFYAEAISLLEVQKALQVGFKPEQVILNGPGKWWPAGLMPDEPLHAVFADSVADLERIATAAANGELQSKVFGIRLRTPHITSRFGIPLNTPEDFGTLVDSVSLLPRESAFGVHFHMASSNIGVRQWWHLFQSMIRWCRAIEKLTGRNIEVLDIGGGWFPDDWHEGREDDFTKAVKYARATLPHLREIISEPGKAVAQPSMAVAMRVLEIQEISDESIEAVVDGSIAELPMYFFYPHRILRRDGRTGELEPLKRGKTRLMGRLCMEHDEVATNVELPEGTQPGDVLIFCDAGGYDRSMSYVFGKG